MIMGLLFVECLRSLFQDGLDPRKVIVVGISLAIGMGLQSNNVVSEIIGGAWGILLGNGMIIGSLTAILLTVVTELMSPRRRRLEVELDIAALPQLDEFLGKMASSVGWDESSSNRLRFIGEETLTSLLEDETNENPRRLQVLARPGAHMIELEFLAVLRDENLEDRIAYLSEHSDSPEAQETSLRLLSHFASAVHHRKYHGIDIITVEVSR